MANYPYKRPSTPLDTFRENLIDFQEAVEGDFRNVQGQVSSLVAEGDSSPAAAQAKVDVKGVIKSTLKERLDDDYTELSGKVESKADRAALEAVASGGPKKVFQTYSDLLAAYPEGSDGMFLIENDVDTVKNGKWFYWDEEKAVWAQGFQYQTTGITDKTISPLKTTFQQVNLSNVTWEQGYFISRLTGAKVAHSDQEFFASGYINFPYEGIDFIVKTATFNDDAGLAFYNIDKAFISGMITGYDSKVLTETPFTPPKNTAFIRFTCKGPDKMPNVALTVQSNPIEVATGVTKKQKEELEILENKSTIMFSDLFKSYFVNAGNEDDVAQIFKNIKTYRAGINGKVSLGDEVVILTEATSMASGGVGFRIDLPGLTPDVMKVVGSLQLEMDISMQTPIPMTHNVGLYAIKKSTGGNSNAPLVIYGNTLEVAEQQHVSKVINFSYENIIDIVVANGDVTLNDISHFALYIHGWGLFTNNIITISNVFLKRDNSVDNRIKDLDEKTENLSGVIQQLYDNYSLTEEGIYQAMEPFSTTKGKVTIDNENKVITIDETTSLSGGSAGIRFALSGFYESLKEVGSISIDFIGKATFNGSLLVQFYPHTKNGNFNAPYASNTFVDTGQGIDIGLRTSITLESLEEYFTSNNFDINTLSHFVMYIRANTMSLDFDCTVTDLAFNREIVTKGLKEKIELLTGENNTVVPLSEKPLDVIKRDGGLFSIFHKVAYIGDSLSSGEHEYKKADGSTGYVDLFDFSYGQVIARATGTKAINLSSGGRTAATWLTGFSDQAFNNPDNICPAYIIYLGTNDLSSSKNPYGMGNVSSDVDLNDYNNNGLTFAGRYATILQKIKEVQPKARIFCCTLPNSPSNEADRATNPIIRELVDLFDFVYLIDLHEYAETISNSFRMGGHLTSAGYTIFAWHVMSYIDYIIRKYPNDFKEVAFIGTDYKYL